MTSIIASRRVSATFTQKAVTTELNRIDLKPLPCEGKTYSGAFPMQNGLEMPYTHDVEYSKKNDWASRVLLIEEYVGNK